MTEVLLECWRPQESIWTLKSVNTLLNLISFLTVWLVEPLCRQTLDTQPWWPPELHTEAREQRSLSEPSLSPQNLLWLPSHNERMWPLLQVVINPAPSSSVSIFLWNTNLLIDGSEYLKMFNIVLQTRWDICCYCFSLMCKIKWSTLQNVVACFLLLCKVTRKIILWSVIRDVWNPCDLSTFFTIGP